MANIVLADADRNERVVTLSDIEERLRTRADGIEEWLREIESDCKTDQRHCVEGTVERTYWHYGYMIALRDVLDLLRQKSEAVH